MNPNHLKHDLDYMYDYVSIIYAFVKFLDELPVIICLSCHPGPLLEIVIRVLGKGLAELPHSSWSHSNAAVSASSNLKAWCGSWGSRGTGAGPIMIRLINSLSVCCTSMPDYIEVFMIESCLILQCSEPWIHHLVYGYLAWVPLRASSRRQTMSLKLPPLGCNWSPRSFIQASNPMSGKNRQLVTDGPVKVGDVRRITDHFRGIYGGIYLKWM